MKKRRKLMKMHVFFIILYFLAYISIIRKDSSSLSLLVWFHTALGHHYLVCREVWVRSQQRYFTRILKSCKNLHKLQVAENCMSCPRSITHYWLVTSAAKVKDAQKIYRQLFCQAVKPSSNPLFLLLLTFLLTYFCSCFLPTYRSTDHSTGSRQRDCQKTALIFLANFC